MFRETARNILAQAIGEKSLRRVLGLKNRLIPPKERYLILIDTTDGCNLKCTFCSRDNLKPILMKASEFDTILRRLKGHISSLQLSCAWEYSIAKNSAEVLRILGKHNVPSTSLYTNGNVLTDTMAEALIDSKLEQFVVSIGEAKKETYERIRAGGRFERVISNIKKLAALKDQHSVTHPKICANLTLIRSNIEELPDFIDLAHEIGITEIRGRHLILNKGLGMDEEVIQDVSLANRMIEAASEKASSYGMDFFVPGYPVETTAKQCRAPWERLYISSNGDVSVCPRIHKYEKIGNLIEQSLESIIHGSELKMLKDQFERSDFKNPVCEICMANRETEIEIEQGF